MFVRWKNRTLAKKHGGVPAERSLYAVVVKNQRVDGRTKQKVVKYLAHIGERSLHDVEHQANFWLRADQALAELELTPEQRAEIEEKLLTVVPRPPAGIKVFTPPGPRSTMDSAMRQRSKSLERTLTHTTAVES